MNPRDDGIAAQGVIDRWLTRRDRAGYLFWGLLAALVVGYDAVVLLTEAFAHPFVIQDDARQHVFWMRRFVDPDLFPGDLIADYFQSVAPYGYTQLYRGAAALGIDPVFLSKVLPVPLLALFAAFGFALGVRMIGSPAAGFLVAFAFAQNAWLMDNISSATPRAFLYPFLAAFFYFLLRHSAWGVVLSIVLLGLFYPPMAMMAGAVAAFQLIEFRGWRPVVTADLAKGRVALLGLAVAFAVLAPFALKVDSFGPVISAEAARLLPEFGAGGRAAFFNDSAWEYWVCGFRSGLVPIEWCNPTSKMPDGLPPSALGPVLLAFFLVLPFWLRARGGELASHHVGGDFDQLVRLLAVSFVLFIAAHIALFQLHLPSRYTHHTLRMAFDIAAAALVFMLARHGARALAGRHGSRVGGAAALLFVVALVGIFVPVPGLVGDRGFVVGRHPELYHFLRETPAATVVASLESEADNLPTFARRGVLTAREYQIPYHRGYAEPLADRTQALMRATYADNPAVVRTFIERYRPGYWLIHDDTFKPSRLEWTWYAETFPDQARSARSAEPAYLERRGKTCIVLREGSLSLIDVACLRQHLDPSSDPAGGES